MTALRQRMIEDMQLRGLSRNTRANYVREVRKMAEYYARSPDLLTEEEVRQYFLHLKHEKKVASGTLGVAIAAVKFLYVHTLKREWPTLDLVRISRERKLPVVLSVEEVHAILEKVRKHRYRVCLSIIYACGLRLSEAVRLQVGHIDSQ